MNARLKRLFPFLGWFPYRGEVLRADLLAGLTVALVLVPQSMAYAQLAGMPAFYGLYAAFLPVAVAALWGSSNQLATGPVAVVSLLTASSLATLAAPGSEQFIVLAVMLAALVGLVQLTLGILKLGVIVNFLSHPVIVGFTNAAALIIAASQVNKLMGVPMGRSDVFLKDIWDVARQAGETHLPTLAMGASAIAIIWFLRRKSPKLPGVLIAVALATLVSWQIGFEKTTTVRAEDVLSSETQDLMREYRRIEERAAELEREIGERSVRLKEAKKEKGEVSPEVVTLNYEIDLLRMQLKDRHGENRGRNRTIRSLVFERVPATAGVPDRLYREGQVPAGLTTDGQRWRIKRVGAAEVRLSGGGDVVGSIPEGLPTLSLPTFDWEMLGSLLSAAFVISLVGFMESISIAKAMAARTRERIDPNQELIGQGLANLVGSCSQAFPVSGSFSRSAVNLNAGARTGMSSVFASVIVLTTLLFLTPLLYHLPQAVLAAVIIMAVVGLINIEAVKHAWRASRHDGIAAISTFVATLAFAPHLDNGILAGAGIAITLYLLRTMKPRVAILGRHPDGSLRDAQVHNLPSSEIVTAVRFDGRLYFANVSYFEDAILEAVAANPKAKYLLVVGNGINELDASGEEVVHHLVERLRGSGIRVMFSGLKKQVIDVMQATGLYALIGEANVFVSADQALATIYEVAQVSNDALRSPEAA